MGKSGKRYDTAAAGFDRDQMYSGSEALGLVSSLAAAKFDESKTSAEQYVRYLEARRRQVEALRS